LCICCKAARIADVNPALLDKLVSDS